MELIMDPITDIESNPELLEKIRNNFIYAQNLYAALCNNDFIKLDPWAILNNTVWNCSWRMAGGYVAQLRGDGENETYTDYYCSGLSDQSGFQTESDVTREILADLNNIGWTIVNPNIVDS